MREDWETFDGKFGKKVNRATWKEKIAPGQGGAGRRICTTKRSVRTQVRERANQREGKKPLF